MWQVLHRYWNRPQNVLQTSMKLEWQWCMCNRFSTPIPPFTLIMLRVIQDTPPPIRPKAVKRITNLPWFLHAARPPSHRARLFSVQNEDAQTVRASNMQVTSISRLCRPFSMDENLIQKLHPGPSVTHGIRLLFFDCENQVPGRRRGLIKIMRTFRGANRDVALYRCVGFRLRRLSGEDVFTIESWINNRFNGCCIFLNEYFSSRLEVVILITSLMYISKLLIQEKFFFFLQHEHSDPSIAVIIVVLFSSRMRVRMKVCSSKNRPDKQMCVNVYVLVPSYRSSKWN